MKPRKRAVCLWDLVLTATDVTVAVVSPPPRRLLEELLQKEKEYQQVLKATLQQRTHDLELVRVRHRPPGRHTDWPTDWLVSYVLFFSKSQFVCLFVFLRHVAALHLPRPSGPRAGQAAHWLAERAGGGRRHRRQGWASVGFRASVHSLFFCFWPPPHDTV